jgi:hypothetical protein
MDAAAIAEGQETDGLARQAQRDLRGLSFPAGWRGDRKDQSDSARVGEILCHRPLESVFLIHPILGRKEDQAPSGQGVPASRIRLEAVGQGMAVQNARTLLGVPGFLWAVDLGSRSGVIGPINLVVNCGGARSAGNPLATCDVAGAGNQLTVRIVRHSQRKRGATDRPDLRSNGTSPRPYRRVAQPAIRADALHGSARFMNGASKAGGGVGCLSRYLFNPPRTHPSL